jgi:hypothetical protein
MFIPDTIIIMICEMDNSIPIQLLNKKFYKYYMNKRTKNINIIKKWYKSRPLIINDNLSLQNIPKALIIRNILKNKNNNIHRCIITLPEFICLQLKNPKLLTIMRSLPKHSERKISSIISFLLNKEIKNHIIMNSFNIIWRLQENN